MLCFPTTVLKKGVSFVHPNFCPELAFFPYALGHLLASAAHSSPIIHATTKPTAHVFPTEGAHSFSSVFVSVCFVSTVLRKGSVAAKGAIPDAFASQYGCRSSWNCAWLNLPCHGQVWCVAQTPQHKAAAKEKIAKGSHVEPQTLTESSPELEQVPEKG